MAKPLHVSVRWGSIGDFFVGLAECATQPSLAFPKNEEEDGFDWGFAAMGVGAAVVAVAAGVVVWKKTFASTN
jgi:Ras family protein T1